jgi:dihydropteroate synthase
MTVLFGIHSMAKTYLRPLAFSFGPDAGGLIANGSAGSLGGMAHLAFSMVEEIQRDGKIISRSIHTFADLKNHPLIGEIIKPRSYHHTTIMGIVNVTPDSFSDGGQHGETEQAIAHGLRLAEQGAEILDVGGESTRPGSDEVSLDAERARVMPVIAELSKNHVVSIDTRKPELMREAKEHGAHIINDVSALGFSDESLGAAAQLQMPVILMHAQGEPRTMQLAPKYQNVALDVYDFLEARIAACVASGIPKSLITIDPGIGFGKTIHHNLELLRQLTLFHGLGVSLLVGLSRKNMVGVLTGEKLAANRVAGSVGGALQAAMMGAHLLRVHDVKETVDALAVFSASLDPNLAAV